MKVSRLRGETKAALLYFATGAIFLTVAVFGHGGIAILCEGLSPYPVAIGGAMLVIREWHITEEMLQRR